MSVNKELFNSNMYTTQYGINIMRTSIELPYKEGIEHVINKLGFYRLELSLPLSHMELSKTFKYFKAHKWARTFSGDSRYTIAVDVNISNEFQVILKKELKLSLPEQLEEALKAVAKIQLH